MQLMLRSTLISSPQVMDIRDLESSYNQWKYLFGMQMKEVTKAACPVQRLAIILLVHVHSDNASFSLTSASK